MFIAPPVPLTALTALVSGVVSYERGGNARRKIWIKPLKETNLGGAQPFFDP